MRAQKIGRALGIGVRVAARIAGQQLAGPAHAAARATPAAPAPAVSGTTRAEPAQNQPSSRSQPQNRVSGQKATPAAVKTGRNVRRGVAGFFSPFRRVGGILWLEVTGVFFLLPVVVFTPNLWRYRASVLHGPDHRTFLVTACVVLLFLYLGVSSFWRAHRRSSDAN